MPHYARAAVTTMTLAAGCNHISILILCYLVCSSCCKTFQLSTWWNYKKCRHSYYLFVADCSNEKWEGGNNSHWQTLLMYNIRDGSKRIILPKNLTVFKLQLVTRQSILLNSVCTGAGGATYCNHFCWLSKWINNNVADIHISWTGRLRKCYGIVYIRLQLTLSLVIR